jgi:hypothetical protein
MYMPFVEGRGRTKEKGQAMELWDQQLSCSFAPALPAYVTHAVVVAAVALISVALLTQ